MQVPIGAAGWYLCGWADEAAPGGMELAARDALAVQWLHQFHGDVFALRNMRRMLGTGHPWPDDEQVFAEVGSRLASGVWKARRAALVLYPAGAPAGAAEAAPFPKEERRPAPSPSSSPTADPPVFPGDIDPAAIAQAQKEAAALGVPFCEECLRAQLAGQ